MSPQVPKGLVPASSLPNSARTRQVVAICEALVEADGNPLDWEDLCEDVGVKYPADIMPAMTALEIAGAVTRFTYAVTGSTKKRTAFALPAKEAGDE